MKEKVDEREKRNILDECKLYLHTKKNAHAYINIHTFLPICVFYLLVVNAFSSESFSF